MGKSNSMLHPYILKLCGREKVPNLWDAELLRFDNLFSLLRHSR